MMNTKKTITDTSDGATIAEIFGIYLNTFKTRHKLFMDLMWGADWRVKHNFTMLCMEWFQRIAYVNFYDIRNEASIRTAQAILARTQQERIYFELMDDETIQTEMTVDYRNNADMQVLLECYLKQQDVHKPFMTKMLGEYWTLQQNFTRFCLNWLDTVSQKNEVGYVHTRIARTALAEPIYLPLL